MVHERNKPHRLSFAKQCVRSRDTFDNVIYTDESSIQLESTPAMAFEKVSYVHVHVNVHVHCTSFL